MCLYVSVCVCGVGVAFCLSTWSIITPTVHCHISSCIKAPSFSLLIARLYLPSQQLSASLHELLLLVLGFELQVIVSSLCLDCPLPTLLTALSHGSAQASAMTSVTSLTSPYLLTLTSSATRSALLLIKPLKPAPAFVSTFGSFPQTITVPL